MRYHIFFVVLGRLQHIEKWASCSGSKSIITERQSFGKKQFLEPLLLVERRLHPKPFGVKNHILSKRKHVFNIKVFKLRGSNRDLCLCNFIVELLLVSVVSLLVNHLAKDQGLLELFPAF
jgi:hypothetical protein